MSYVTHHLMPGEAVVRETHLSRFVYLPALVLLALAGLLLVLQGDHATITVTPLDAAAASPRPSGKTEGAWLASSPAASAPGLGVRLTF